jgi:cystathionine beta-lyase/cystathionine gamma-synthase
MRKPGRATVAAHSTREIESVSEPLSPPIHLASVHRFGDLDTLLEAYRGKKSPWNFYRRFGHPNGRLLEETLAALEGTEDALACASGMAAVTTIFLALAGKNDRVVACRDLYGGTHAFLRRHLGKTGARADFVGLADVASEVGRGAKLCVVETISNPLIRTADLAPIARACRKAGTLLIVDNTFATPFLCRPAEWGADIVFHSATKFLNGHGDATGGVICGPRARIAEMRGFASGVGTTISPMDAWLTLRGLKTLGLRIERASRNAVAVASLLARHPKVRTVNYPAPSKYLKPARGAMLSFELKGGLKAAARFVKACRLVELVPSLGDVTTTSTHPARSSHAYLSPAERAELGVTDGLVRISTGIEDVDDILEDLRQALAKA